MLFFRFKYDVSFVICTQNNYNTCIEATYVVFVKVEQVLIPRSKENQNAIYLENTMCVDVFIMG